MEVRELTAAEDALAVAALAELRPHVDDIPAALGRLRDAEGLRVLAAFDGDTVAGVATCKPQHSLAHGRVLFVDDLITREAARGRGAATALLDRIDALATELGCAAVHLDSGVQAERQAAHRRYFSHGMRIASYRFAKSTG